MTDSLISRAEAAGESETREVLREAFRVIWPEIPSHKEGFAERFYREERFTAMLDASAGESAALMLLPEGWAIDCLKEGEEGSWYVNLRPRDWVSEWRFSKAATLALAIASACLRAEAARRGGEGG